jgi:hypothetical protein
VSAGEEQAAEPEAVEAEPADESREMSERTAKVIVVVIACGAMWGMVAAFPWVAYVVVGIGGTLGWQKARGWIVRRREGEGEPDFTVEAELLDVIGALHSLAQDGRNVLLTELKTKLGVADTKTVRALLDEVLIPVRPGVRTPAGNGPGVHNGDVPPVAGGSPGGRCLCRSDANANGNNGGGEGAGEGLRVVPLGAEGKIVYDPADSIRHFKTDGGRR